MEKADERAFLDRILHAQKSTYLLALSGDTVIAQSSLSCQENRQRHRAVPEVRL